MLKNYYEQIILYNFLLKNKVKNIFQIIKIEKINLNIGCKDNFMEKTNLINIFLFLKLITNQKSLITKAKKNNLFLKIKKNNITGCKVILRKKNAYFFLEKIILFILNEKEKIKINNNIINFKIYNILDFIEFKGEIFKFQNIPQMDISIHIINEKNVKLFANYFLL